MFARTCKNKQQNKLAELLYFINQSNNSFSQRLKSTYGLTVKKKNELHTRKKNERKTDQSKPTPPKITNYFPHLLPTFHWKIQFLGFFELKVRRGSQYPGQAFVMCPDTRIREDFWIRHLVYLPAGFEPRKLTRIVPMQLKWHFYIGKWP